jgi:23S rRNA pseudouridine955/2504/2580 synthase
MEKTPAKLPPGVEYREIEDGVCGQRIDNWLLASLKGVPKSHVYRILRKGEVRVNRGRVKPTYRLQKGDVVRIPPIRIAEKKVYSVADQLLKLLEDSILLENSGLMILNKPAGLAVHGGSGLNYGLIEALRQLRPAEKNLELVHRLDRETSGCVMVAKKRGVLRALHQQLREGGVDKRYLALAAGRWPKRKTRVDAPLEKNIVQSGERIVKVSAQGKPSVTEFELLKHYPGCSLVEARPITGRTHQIRVHARHAGFPLVGDEKYGDDECNRRMREVGINRLFLHAKSLALTMPGESGQLRVEAPLDKKLEKALENIDN